MAAILIILGAVIPFVATVIRGHWGTTVGPEYPEQFANLFMIGLVYCVLARVVLGGRNWARITVTVLTVFVSYGGLIGLVQFILAAGGFLSGGELFRLFLLATALVALVVGVVLLYIPAANAYFAQSRAYRAMRD